MQRRYITPVYHMINTLSITSSLVLLSIASTVLVMMYNFGTVLSYCLSIETVLFG